MDAATLANIFTHTSAQSCEFGFGLCVWVRGNVPHVRGKLPHPSLAAVAIGALACASITGCSVFFPPGSPVDFCVEQAAAFCDLQFKCCTAAERRADLLGAFGGSAVTRRAPSDAGECLGVMTDICYATVDAQAESLREERVEFDPDEAEDCITELRTAVDECDPQAFFEAQGTYLASLIDSGRPGVLGDGCDNVIEGVVDEGDECFASYECQKGQCLATGPDVTIEGECVGTDTPVNPFDNANVDFEYCDGLEEE